MSFPRASSDRGFLDPPTARTHTFLHHKVEVQQQGIDHPDVVDLQEFLHVLLGAFLTLIFIGAICLDSQYNSIYCNQYIKNLQTGLVGQLLK